MFGAVGITQGDYSVTKEEKHRNMFMGREMTEQLPPVKEVTTSGKQLIGGKRTALVVLSCNRPQFLVKTVKEDYQRTSDAIRSLQAEVQILQNFN